MAWFADLAVKAESLLNNLDEQTGVALRNHIKQKKHNFSYTEPPTGPKRRPLSRNLNKNGPMIDTRSNDVPVRKISPTSHSSRMHFEFYKEQNPRRKSPTTKTSLPYTLNNCPKTLVDDLKGTNVSTEKKKHKQRRYSFPTDLELINNDEIIYKMQNLEVENAMLSNELNVLNQELSELLDRLRKTEDELGKVNAKLDDKETSNKEIKLENDSLNVEVNKLKTQLRELTTNEFLKHKQLHEEWQIELNLMREKNRELEESINKLNEKVKEKNNAYNKLEKEHHHTQSVITELQMDLEKSNKECQRLEKEWDAYKIRVKTMLQGKDKEISALQEGLNFNEDTKILLEQLDLLKEERDDLSESISQVRNECDTMKEQMEQLENRYNAAERMVVALRDALRDERTARNRAEAQCVAIGKELKSMQMETDQIIASLKIELRDKQSEIDQLREASSARSTDTSALNVGDYGAAQESIDNQKLQCLTQTLVHKQRKIDSLLADNNVLRIQLDNLESKYKAEVHRKTHTQIQVSEGECRSRSRGTKRLESVMSKFSLRIGMLLRRYPLFRIFIIFYMIGLHFWVLTVLFTSTPDGYNLTRPTKL